MCLFRPISGAAKPDAKTVRCGFVEAPGLCFFVGSGGLSDERLEHELNPLEHA